MTKDIFRRLAIIPLALLVANFVGFAFAFTVSPIVQASHPYTSRQAELPPLIPIYWEYLKGVGRGEFGERLRGNRFGKPSPVLELPVWDFSESRWDSASCWASRLDAWRSAVTGAGSPPG